MLREPRPWDEPKTAKLVSKSSAKTQMNTQFNYEMAPREYYPQRSHDIRVEINYNEPREFFHPQYSAKQQVAFKPHNGHFKNTELTFEQWEYYYGSDKEESD